MKDSKHFSLIELLVVTLILGFTLGIAFTALDDLTGSSRLASTARHLGDFLSLTRNEAASQGKVFRIHYDLEKNEYWMEIPFAEDNETAATSVLSRRQIKELTHMPPIPLKSGIVFEDIMLSQSEKRTGGKVSVEFSPFGFSAGHIIHLRTESGQQISVEINGLTGISSYYDTYKEFDQIIPFDNN